MNKEILNALVELEREKGINQDVVLEAIRSALETGYKKNYGKATNFSIEIDKVNGEYRLYQDKTVVAGVENSNLEISLEEAKTIDKRYELGDIVKIEIKPKKDLLPPWYLPSAFTMVCWLGRERQIYWQTLKRMNFILILGPTAIEFI